MSEPTISDLAKSAYDQVKGMDVAKGYVEILKTLLPALKAELKKSPVFEDVSISTGNISENTSKGMPVHLIKNEGELGAPRIFFMVNSDAVAILPPFVDAEEYKLKTESGLKCFLTDISKVMGAEIAQAEENAAIKAAAKALTA